MGSQVVPLRLDSETLEFIDSLVRLGVFSSRSEALRELVKAGIKSYESFSKIVSGVEKLFEMERREGDIPIELTDALRQLLEERDRFSP